MCTSSMRLLSLSFFFAVPCVVDLLICTCKDIICRPLSFRVNIFRAPKYQCLLWRIPDPCRNVKLLSSHVLQAISFIYLMLRSMCSFLRGSSILGWLFRQVPEQKPLHSPNLIQAVTPLTSPRLKIYFARETERLIVSRPQPALCAARTHPLGETIRAERAYKSLSQSFMYMGAQVRSTRRRKDVRTMERSCARDCGLRCSPPVYAQTQLGPSWRATLRGKRKGEKPRTKENVAK